MALDYLLFERSEQADGAVCFEAAAAVPLARWPRLEAELREVLGWASRQSERGPGELDEGHDWDYALQASEESACAATLSWEATEERLTWATAPQAVLRRSVHLSLQLSPWLAEAFESAGFAGSE